MREQLVFLLQLQTADARVRELETASAQLPAKLDPLRRDLAKLQGMLDAERGKLSETEAWRRSQQDLVDREREALKQAQGKLQQSKNTKEWSAANREVDNKRKSIGDREVELRKVSDAQTTSSSALEGREKDIEALRTQLADSEAAMAGEAGDLASKLADAKALRDSARSNVEKQWLKVYDTLLGKRGYAVAPVVKGVCQGCHMTLPPQLNNILARMQSIESCPRCARLIYRKELLDPPAAESETSGDAPKAST
jgi:predicted  nucleic acid-binding Zn-ribbon protein